MAKFFTKKVCLITLTVIVALTGIIWAIVANITPRFNSGFSAIPTGYVSGNGTASVMIGDYLYFVGGTTADLKYGDNEYYTNGVMPDSGIYRVKIGKDSVPVLNYQYDNTYQDENTGEKKTWQQGDANYNSVVTEIKDWERIGEKGNGIEAVVPKIAGHENTAMWIFGKYLIYTSPHNRLDSRGNLMSDRLDFFRVDLNGENHTLIYTSNSTDLTTKNFTVWADSTKNIYLLVNETNNQDEDAKASINRINVVTKEVKTLDSDVTNVVLPNATQYGKQNETLEQVYGGVMGYVYYTKSRDENSSLKGNLLYRCSIKDIKTEDISGNSATATRGTTFTPLAVTPVDVDGAHANAQFVYQISITNNQASLKKDLCVITNENLAGYTYSEPGMDSEVGALLQKTTSTTEIYANYFCRIADKLYHYEVVDGQIVLDKNSNNEALVLSSATVDAVLAVMNDNIYVKSGQSVYMINQNGTSNSISFATTQNTDEESESESTDQNILPLAVLYQPQNNNGDPMVWVATAQSLRLFAGNGKFHYLRLNV